MYAAIATVDIAAGQFDSAQKVLANEIVPRVSKGQGFIRGYWTIRDDKPEVSPSSSSIRSKTPRLQRRWRGTRRHLQV